MRAIFLSLLLVTAASAAPVDVTRLDGSTVSGELVAWSEEGVTIKNGSEPQQILADQLLSLAWEADDGPADASATFLELVDGSRLRITDFSTRDHVASVASPYADEALKTSTDRIRWVELTPRTEAAATIWQELENKELADDVLIVSKREGQSFDYLAGVAGDVKAQEAGFQWEGERMAVKRSKIAAIFYFHNKAARFPDPVCELATDDGSRIPTRHVELRDDRLRITTPAGLKLEVKLADLRKADFSAGKLAYLSDLKPSEVKWTPRIAAPTGATLIADFGMPRYDQSYAGSALTLMWKDDPLPARRDVRVYAKGLAIRSRTELTWRLPDGMQRFSAIAGIDPQAANQGRVILQVRGDGKMLWEGPINGREPPVPLDLDLKGRARLQVTVDYGENLDYGDRLHLVEARVTK